MRVGLFVTCLADLMRPSIGLATLKLLEQSGCEVIVPGTQTCCGQPGYNSGDRAAAQTLARKLISEFDECEYVVVPSGSCGGMIKTHYAELLEFTDAKAKAEWLAARTWELTDFLVNVIGMQDIEARFDGTVTYHDSCAGLRELGVKTQPRDLLSKVDGLAIKELEGAEQCCGFGGTFAIKYGDISSRLADLKCEDVEKTAADALVLGDLGCMLTIEGRLRRRGDKHTKVLHIAEVLTGMTGTETE